MNAAQLAIVNALLAGKAIRVSNRNDVASGKAHHATVKALVKIGAVVVNADKTLALTASERHASKGKASNPKLDSLRESLAFARERAETCRKMMQNRTVDKVRYEQWVRKVAQLEKEIREIA